MKELVGIVVAVCLLCMVPGEWLQTKYATGGGERPTVNVPFSLRQANWQGPRGEGCCCFAALCTDLQWFGKELKAREIRTQCGDGQSPQSLAVEMAKHDIRFAWTVGDDDVAFLDQAIASRRGVMVCINEDGGRDSHMVLLAHLDGKSACLIDSNMQGVNRWWGRDAFIKEWCESGSWGVVVLGAPAPPLAQ